MPRKKKTENEESLKEKLEEGIEKVEEKIKDIAEDIKEKVEEMIIDKKTKGKKKSSKKSEEKTKQESKEKSEKEEDKKKKLDAVKEKAKELEKKIEIKDKINLDEVKEEIKIKKTSKRTKTPGELFPLDDYVKYSAHLGTKAVTPTMRKFVYRRRADGIAVLNTNDIDSMLKEAAEFLKDFKAEDTFLACKREAGWNAAKKFGEVTGIKVFTKKYPVGIITNIQLADFFEPELVIICDPWLDKNALNEAVKVKKPVIGLCDTNNLTRGITKVVPCNNKSEKSLGLIFYLLAREYLKYSGKESEAKNLNIEDFCGKVEDRSERFEQAAKEGV